MLLYIAHLYMNMYVCIHKYKYIYILYNISYHVPYIYYDIHISHSGLYSHVCWLKPHYCWLNQSQSCDGDMVNP